MMKIIFLFVLLTISSRCKSQDGENPLPFVIHEPVYDTAPQFPGGATALLKFFADSIRYPEPEKSKGLQGGVSTKFIVDTSGAVKNVRLLNGVPYAPHLAAEAVRLIYSMPKWIPATKNKKPVQAEYYLSIPFIIKE